MWFNINGHCESDRRREASAENCSFKISEGYMSMRSTMHCIIAENKILLKLHEICIVQIDYRDTLSRKDCFPCMHETDLIKMINNITYNFKQVSTQLCQGLGMAVQKQDPKYKNNSHRELMESGDLITPKTPKNKVTKIQKNQLVKSWEIQKPKLKLTEKKL